MTRKINIALAGNPNAGKTSIFNLLTGLHHKVGNWPGVTVEKYAGEIRYKDYQIEVVDLPGTYSLTSYTIEEKVAREYILNARPDVIINVIDSANLERNLDLTIQLLEMEVDVILDLNMWDEFTKSGARIDLEKLERLTGAPVVTTVGHRQDGKTALLDAVLRLCEDRDQLHRHIPISVGSHAEDVLVDLAVELETAYGEELNLPVRYGAAKLIEGDPFIIEMLHNRKPEATKVTERLIDLAEEKRRHIRQATGLEPDRVLADGRYGFIRGLLSEIKERQPLLDRMEFSRQLDRVLTHRLVGIPMFMLFMWLLFNTTFTLGAYPMAWIESLFSWLGDLAAGVLPSGFVSDLVVVGILGGVGSVAVFIPNIMILFLGISILEDSGYMARVAFIMDRVMHLFGLHGKSFIPMLMGFGCTVPAIMATRTLESQRDRILTSLLLPHMSCAARFPVYVLFAGAFFARFAGNVVFGLYLFGVLVALLMGLLFSRTLFRKEEAAFVMELPPYRWPTGRGLFGHMWHRTWCYIKKIGTVILIASAVLWFLGAYPQNPASETAAIRIAEMNAVGAAQEEIKAAELARSAADMEYTVIGRLGKLTEPLIRPLGFDWRMGVSIITGFVAKEVVVSTMGVLYRVGDDETEGSGQLREALRAPQYNLTPLKALAFLVFILLYTPCIAAILAIRRELGARWMWFDVGYQLVLAWVMSFLVYQGGQLLGFG
jgi:ferrous iron transport protein B